MHTAAYTTLQDVQVNEPLMARFKLLCSTIVFLVFLLSGLLPVGASGWGRGVQYYIEKSLNHWKASINQTHTLLKTWGNCIYLLVCF